MARGMRIGRRLWTRTLAVGSVAVLGVLGSGCYPTPPDQYLSETHTVTVDGVPCTVKVESERTGNRAWARTSTTSDRSQCTDFYWNIVVDYVQPSGDLGWAGIPSISTGQGYMRGPGGSLEISGVRELTRSWHAVAYDFNRSGLNNQYVLRHTG
jgi:hypothetical protein